MDRRVFVLFSLLTAVRSDNPQTKPEISFDEKNSLVCKDGTFGGKASIPLSYENSGLHTCTAECTDDTCPKQNVLVKILKSENLIQPDIKALVSVIISDIFATVLIGWAIYSICAQAKSRGGYQGNKASDRQALISNHNPPGADTYQPLNTRADEYSTLHAQRKNKSKQSV